MKLKGLRKKEPSRQSALDQARANRGSFSYYSASRSAEEGKRPRLQLRKQREFVINLRKIPMIIITLCLIGIVVFSTTLSSSPMILFAEKNSPYRTTEAYKKEITNLLQDSLLTRSKLTISSTKLEAKILATFPELDAARVVLPIVGRRPAVTLHARTPQLMLYTGQKVLIIDSTGRAVSEAAALASSVRDGLLQVQDQSALVPEVGDQALTAEAVNFLYTFQQQLLAKGAIIEKTILPAVANEADIYLKDTAYYLKTDYAGEARAQSGAYLAAKDSFASKGQPKEYVDVRVEEKVFYK